MCAAYVMIIIAGVGGLLAPVVLLSPLLIILCFAGFGTWKKSQKEGMSGIHICVTSYENHEDTPTAVPCFPVNSCYVSKGVAYIESFPMKLPVS